MADIDSPALPAENADGKKRRRSWFDANNASLKFEIAVEKTAASRPPLEEEQEIEVLELTHFTNPPRIDFGKVRTGRTKTRHILVRNPHDYEQQVVIEKFPTKKQFSVDHTEFSVDVDEELLLTLTWQPTEAMYCREMVLFKVDDVYRLQAILFGSAQEPPKPKTRRAGLGRGKKKPFSEISPNTNRLRPGIKKDGVKGGALGRENIPKAKVSTAAPKRSSAGRKVSPKGRKSSPKNRENDVRRSSGNKTRTRTSRSPEGAVGNIENVDPGFLAGGLDAYRPGGRVGLVQDDPNLPQSPARRTTFVQKKGAYSGGDVQVRSMGSTMTLQESTEVENIIEESITVDVETRVEEETRLEIQSSMPTTKISEKQQNLRSTITIASASSTEVQNTFQSTSTTGRKMVLQTHTVAFSSTDEEEEQIQETNFSETYGLDAKLDLNLPAAPLSDSPERRETYIKPTKPATAQYNRVELVKDDPNIPDSPARRTTFLKDDPEMPLTPLRRTTFQKDDPEMPLTPLRRTTFQKDDPEMPLTPIRRMTYYKDEPNLPHTPVVEVEFARSKSASPPRTGSGGQPVRFADDTRADLLVTPTTALIRQGTYTKLNSSLSPRPHRIHFTPSSPQIPELRENSDSSSADDLDLTRDSLEKMEDKFMLGPADSLRLAVKPLEKSPGANAFPEDFPVAKNLQSSGSQASETRSPPMTLDDLLLSPDEIDDATTKATTATSQRAPPLRSARASQESSPTNSEYITPLTTCYATPCGGSPGEEDYDISSLGQSSLTAYFEEESHRRETLVSMVSEKLSHLSVSEDFEQKDTTGHSVLLRPTIMINSHIEELSPLERTNGGSSTFDKSEPTTADCSLLRDVAEPAELEEENDNKGEVSVPLEGDSPTTVLMNESFGGHQGVIDRLEIVREELQHRLSSTPITNPLLAPRGFTALKRVSALSPIIGQRVDQDTVVKSKPAVLQGVATEESDSKKPSRKELFATEPEERRLSNVTVNKPSAVFDIKFDDDGNLLEMKPQPLLSGAPSNTGQPRRPSGLTITKTKPAIPNREENKSSKKLFSSGHRNTSTANTSSRFTKPPPVSHTRRSMPAPAAKPQPRGRSLQPDAIASLRTRSVSGRIAKFASSLPTDPQKRCHSMERVQNRLSSTGRQVKKVKQVGDKDGDTNKGDISSASVSGRQWTRTQQLRRNSALSAMNKTAPLSKTRHLSGSMSKPKGLAQSKLVLIKNTSLYSSVPSIPKHPMPFAAKNMYYDERWMEKEERGFVQWLNFVLTPPDEYIEAKKPQKIDARLLSVDQDFKPNATLAPTKEILSFRAYAARRRLNRLRRKACNLFQSETIIRVYQKLEIEIESRRLAVRKDRQLNADLGIKQKMLELILSYNPLWLRIGLETVYGELIPVQSNTDVYGLSRFIVTRMLGNPDIARQYAHPTVPHLYREGYDVALSQFALKKFLLLVLFLDMAKVNRLIDHDPCLFCKDADFKASRDLLLTFSKDHLSGEGDLTRHLGYLGYGVKHVQTALEEYDYAVTNLAVDLRDGLKLTRVIELLTQNWQLLYQLRVPAISRLQKIHNMGVAFKEMAERGLDVQTVNGGKLDPRDIVDGHREKTLQLLWRIIFHFQVEQLLNEAQLREEIQFLKDNLKVQTQLAMLEENEADLAEMEERRKSLGLDLYFKSPMLSLLLRWCKSVCAYYNLKIENFTVSFSDGRALCYLLHHYHPSLLPLDQVRTDTTSTYAGPGLDQSASDSDDSFLGNWTQSYSPSTGKATIQDELLANERHNFKLLYEKVLELGGVPFMVRSADMSNTIPDEKVVITYVSYLCSRLLDIRQETRAARIIQAAWRTYWLHSKVRGQKERKLAACRIQKTVRTWLLRRREALRLRCTLTLQCWWRRVRARRQLANLREEKLRHTRYEAAVKLQRCARRYLTRVRIQKHQRAIVTIQKCWRMRRERHHFLNVRKATSTLQMYHRAWKLSKAQKLEYQSLRNAARVLQTAWRERKARMTLKEDRAATLIQKVVRGHWERKCYKKKKMAAVKLQANVRGFTQRRRYLQLRSAATVMQKAYRASLECRQQRAKYVHLKAAALLCQRLYRGKLGRRSALRVTSARKIQAAYRMHKARREFLALRNAATVLQRRYRALSEARQVRKRYHILRGAALTIQSWYRVYRQRKTHLNLRCSVIKIQALVRACQARSRYIAVKKSALVLQRWYRECRLRKQQNVAAVKIQSLYGAWRQRKTFTEQKQAAVTLQAFFRGQKARRNLLRKTAAALIIQYRFRAAVQSREVRKEFLTRRKATTTLQAACRGWRARKLARQLRAAVKIQAAFRGYRQRKNFSRMRAASVRIQSWVRRWYLRRAFLRTKGAVLRIQQRWRATRQMKQQRQGFAVLKSAVLTVQTAVRGYLARRSFNTQVRGFTKLQATYRRRVQRRQYLEMQRAACCIQTRWMATLEMKKCCSEFTTQKRAAVCIQTAVRTYAARRDFVTMRRGFCKLQAIVKGAQQRVKYFQMRRAVGTLQDRWRARILAIQARDAFVLQKRAAIRIQAIYRGHKAREFARQVQAVTRIQAAVRGRRMRQAFLLYRHAVVLAQSVVRGYLARRSFHTQVRGFTKLQATYRGRVQRRQYLEMQRAACCIQMRWGATLEMKKCRSEFTAQKRAAVCIQAAVRAYKARRDFVTMRKGFCKLQAVVKGAQQRAKYLQMRRAVRTLQDRWKARILAIQARDAFLLQKRAAIKIQAIYRGSKAREFARQVRAVTRIQAAVRGCRMRQAFLLYRHAVVLTQSVVRGYLTRKHLQARGQAAKVIQCRWRATLMAKRCQHVYSKQRNAAVKIQACVRGHRARGRYLSMKSGFTLLQALLKGRKQRREYLRLKQATNVIQTCWRATLLGRKQRDRYYVLRKSVTTIQAAFRWHLLRQQVRKLKATIKLQACIKGYLCRKQYLAARQAAVTLQACFRGRCCRQQYNRIKTATLTIQRHYRAHRLTKQAVKTYRTVQDAIVTIQTAIRGYTARKELRRRKAILCIQSNFRAHRARQHVQRIKAVICIQSYYRGAVARRELQRHKAARTIQKTYRGYRSRQRVQWMHIAALIMQTAVRKYLVQQRFRKMREAAIVIQRHWRALVFASTVRFSYMIIRASLIKLQATIKAHQQRQRYLCLRRSVVAIQSSYRCLVQRREFNAEKTAAIAIQCQWRSYRLMKLHREKYMQLQRATLMIQSAYRGMIARRTVARIRATTRIQAALRGYMERKTYRAKQTALLRIQTWYRCQREQIKFQAMRAAAQLIQRKWRAVLAMRETRVMLMRMQAGATIIQAVYRGHRARKFARTVRCARRVQALVRAYQTRQRFLEQKRAAIKIQSLVRRRLHQQKYLALIKSAQIIQIRWRATLTARKLQTRFRRQRQSAVLIQTVYRGYKQRTVFTNTRSAVVKLQAFVRRRMQQRRYLTLMQATRTLQIRWRAKLQGKEICQRYQLQRFAAIRIQATYRGFVERQKYQVVRRGFIQLQARTRGRNGRRRFAALKKAAVIVQMQYRAIAAAKQQLQQYQQLRSATVALQAAFRGRRERAQLQRVQAITRIQSAVRMWQERTKFTQMKRAAVIIQSRFRTRRARCQYAKLRHAAQVVQLRFRAYLKGRQVRDEFCRKRQAVLALQSYCRGFIVRQKVCKLRSAIRIQAAVRGYLQRCAYRLQQRSVVTIQSCMRRWFAQRRYHQMKQQHQAAVCIQRCYRHHREQLQIQERKRLRAEYLQCVCSMTQRHLCIIRIQRAYRRYRAVEFAKHRLQSVLVIQQWIRAKLQRIHYLRLLRCVRALQGAGRVWLQRRHLASTVIQKSVRLWLVRRRAEKRVAAATQLQAAWRGHKVRKQSRNKKVAAARRRLAEATKNATEDKKLCNRTTSALDFLLRYKQLAYILDALMHLDAATKLSPRCCERIVEGNAVCVIYRLIRSCNRSLPHVEIIKLSISILLNLAKYEKTRAGVYEVDGSIDTLLELLQIYREKGGAVFSRTCTLIGILGHDPQWRQEIVQQDRVVDKLRSIHSLTMRKHKMEEKRIATKNKLDASRSFCGSQSFLASQSFCVGSSKPRGPRIRPDWVLRRDSIQEIKEPLPAIKFALNALHIAPK